MTNISAHTKEAKGFRDNYSALANDEWHDICLCGQGDASTQHTALASELRLTRVRKR